MSSSFCFTELFVAAWPTIFALDLARYLVAAGSLVLVLALFGRALAGRRIQLGRATRADICREIGFSLATTLVFSLVGFAVYAGARLGALQLYGVQPPPACRRAGDVSAVVLLHDTYFYWAHRLMHTRWLFRRVHRLHHRSRTPTPWAAYAFAPPEALLEAAIMPLAALAMPMHELSALLFVTHMIIRNVIGHAGVELFPAWWLRVPVLRLVTTTTHHDLHHSSGRWNFGLYFTWWDRWMGTEHPGYAARFARVTESPPVFERRKEEVQ
ncbi:MAG: sterol desaturase family protein [Woeseiaceae bacterium]|nr:sterol desaturase family protein [Woeseiaceae bacterium]